MRKLLMILGAVPIIALMFLGCEKKNGEEVIVHDTIFVEFDEFTYRASGEEETGNLILFTDPNYGDTVRFELFYFDWRYFNDIKVDNFVFAALTYGKTISLSINGELLATSITETDPDGFEYQYLEIPYNTSKKSEAERNRLIELYKAELVRRGY